MFVSMKVYLVKYRKRVEYEGDEFTLFVVAAERSWDAVNLIDNVYKLGTSNLEVSEEVPKIKTFRDIKEATILLTYEC